MNDLTDRLAALCAPGAATASDSAVAADLSRGRRALRIRRRRRQAAFAAVALAAGAGITYGVTTPATPAAQTASRPTVQHARPMQHPRGQSGVPSASRHSPATAGALRLVAYSGSQVPGFRVRRLPQGFNLRIQGSDSEHLVLARATDHTSDDTFVNKIMVSLRSVDDTGMPHGVPVTVRHGTGVLVRDSSGTKTLDYEDGRHRMQIQVWGSIPLTDAQVVEFADGVTVVGNPDAPHG